MDEDIYIMEACRFILAHLQHPERQSNNGHQLRFLKSGFRPSQPFRQQRLKNRKEAVLIEMRENVLTELVHVCPKSFAASLGKNQPHI